MKSRYSIPKYVMAAIVVLFVMSAHAQLGVTGMQVEYRQTPLGIDVQKPRFSWIMTAPDHIYGYSQKAYSIKVWDEQKQLVWDSALVEDSLSLGIVYNGKPLEPATRYTWELSVWSNKGEKTISTSWFETGLMNPRISAWEGAKWIGGDDEDLVFYAHAQSVFNIRYKLQLDRKSKSSRACFVFGANDRRLMDKDLNINGLESRKDESYIALELDVSAVGGSENGYAKLNIYRYGYGKEDKKHLPFKSFRIPHTLINAGNKYDNHQFVIQSVFGLVDIYLNGQGAENKISKVKNANDKKDFKKGKLNLNPIGPGNNFISYPMVADIGFLLPEGQKAYFSKVEILNFRSPSNVLFFEDLSSEKRYSGIFSDQVKKSQGITINNMKYAVAGGEKGRLIAADPSRNAAPMLRTTFKTRDKTIKKARLYVTARGIYEVYVNGKRVGEKYFSPGLTQYNKTQMYQTYDLTGSLEPNADNALGAWLSEGWWSGNITYRGEHWNYFGDRQSLLCKLVIAYDDGSTQTVISTPEKWKYYNDGPIRYGSFFQGEVYDARKEDGIKGWTAPSYDDSTWKKTAEVPLAHTAYSGKVPLEYNDLSITAQIGENPEIVKTLQAKSMQEVRPGVFVYDMGQNMVGVPEITIPGGKRGDTIRIRYAEVKYPDMPEYNENVGMIMLENIRAALNTDLYILKGGDEIIRPRFTFHGYRFIEITGAGALPVKNINGKVISSIDTLTAGYKTSNPEINKLWENISWSLRGNFLSIPTDTPARNERMGWSGDINVFSRAATYFSNIQPFLKKHLLAMRDIQDKSGRFPDVAPVGGGFGGTLWGSAGIIVPWEVYQQYGDLNLLEDHYPAMKDYVDFLNTRIDPDTGILNEGPLGDWLSPEGDKNDNSLLWTAYQIRDLEIVMKTAELLGETEDAQKYRDQYKRRKKHFNETYVDQKTYRTIHSGFKLRKNTDGTEKGRLIDTQASYAIPLAFHAFEEKHKIAAIKHLVEAVRRRNIDDKGIKRPEYSLMTGFIGTASLSEVLSEYGYDADAYRLLRQTSYPSWLFPVLNGATTIWERLDSFTVEGGFGGNNSMNSFNHYAFGAVASWMINYSLGIQRETPGFKTFVLNPEPDPDGIMNWAKGHYDSMYGTIKSEWKISEDHIRYGFTVPPNTSATLYLKGNDLTKVSVSGRPVEEADGVKYLHKAENRLEFRLSSGSYEFEVKH